MPVWAHRGVCRSQARPPVLRHSTEEKESDFCLKIREKIICPSKKNTTCYKSLHSKSKYRTEIAPQGSPRLFLKEDGPVTQEGAVKGPRGKLHISHSEEEGRPRRAGGMARPALRHRRDTGLGSAPDRPAAALPPDARLWVCRTHVGVLRAHTCSSTQLFHGEGVRGPPSRSHHSSKSSGVSVQPTLPGDNFPGMK